MHDVRFIYLCMLNEMISMYEKNSNFERDDIASNRMMQNCTGISFY